MQALEKNGAKAEQLEEISAEASRALNEVREISYDLRPYQLDRLGLTKAIEAVVATAASASQTEFAADIDDIDDLFPEESRINLYRIVQESLNNILKHAAATHARVTVKREAEGVRLAIRDNGKGFAVPGTAQSETGWNGFGLTGIAERVQLLGGRSTVSSVPGKGTEIDIEFNKRGLRNGK